MDDDTVRLPPPGATPQQGMALGSGAGRSKAPATAPASIAPNRPAGAARAPLLLAGLCSVLLVLAGIAGWMFWPSASLPVAEPQRPVAESPPAQPPRPIGPPEVTEAEILAIHPTAPRIVRLRDEPRIFVLLFPDLDSQGAALNRVAALIEKQGQPRDRVLDDAELGTAITGSGATAATYYYGHNYRGEDLVRFFGLADRQGIRLRPEELWLRDQITMLPALGLSAGDVAFIAVPGLDERVDGRMRRAILRHETGHGYFFTNVVFAAHVRRVWRYSFTTADRAALTAYLARGGYDPTQEELMVNETMAYLLFTPDDRFFAAAEVGLSQQRIEELRAMLLEAAPPVAGLR